MAAEDSDIPRNLSNIVVSIHAIATFQALHDYLRPRVAGLMAGGSRLSSMLAALAASGLAPGSSAGFPSEPPKPSTSESASAGATIARRRSQRLSAKKSGLSKDGEGSTNAQAAQSSEGGPSAATGSNVLESPEAAPSDTVVNDDEFAADFTDDEVDVDAEVSCNMSSKAFLIKFLGH